MSKTISVSAKLDTAYATIAALNATVEAQAAIITDHENHIARLKFIVAKRTSRPTYDRPTKSPAELAAHNNYVKACAIAKANPGMLISVALAQVMAEAPAAE